MLFTLTWIPFSRWLRDLFSLGLKRNIKEEDIYETLDEHKSKKLAEKFSKLWEDELNNKDSNNVSLLRVIRKCYGTYVIGFGLVYSTVDSFSRFVHCFHTIMTVQSNQNELYYLNVSDVHPFPSS